MNGILALYQRATGVVVSTSQEALQEVRNSSLASAPTEPCQELTNQMITQQTVEAAARQDHTTITNDAVINDRLRATMSVRMHFTCSCDGNVGFTALPSKTPKVPPSSQTRVILMQVINTRLPRYLLLKYNTILNVVSSQ